MTEQDFRALLALGHETNEVEYKGPGIRTERPFLARVVRAILGMANRRDGGFVILGVEATKLEPVGLSDPQAASWMDYDNLMASINEYARPSVRLDPVSLLYEGKKIVIVRVQEFEEIPILCSKDYNYSAGKNSVSILRRGACYVRSRHKAETSEIPSEEEMRELLELAIDKGVRRFVTRAQKAGLFPPVQPPAASPDDEQLFKDQIEDLE